MAAWDKVYFFTIAVACFSALVSFSVCILFFMYERKSRFLLMVTLLVVSDGLISLNFMIWAGADMILNSDDESLCRVLLPFLNFSVLLSFGFTMLIAQRFRDVNKLQQGQQLSSTPLWAVPVVSLLVTIPIVVMNANSYDTAVGEIINPSTDSGLDKDRDYCYYGSKESSFIANVFCLQLPSLVTVVYNSFAYFSGIDVLSQSAPAVKIREQRRARKYLAVLLLVWIPSLGVNIYHALFLSKNKDPYDLITFLVNLSSLQGVLNSGVYLWGYKPFRKWFKGLACTTYLDFLIFGTHCDHEFQSAYYVPFPPENSQKDSSQQTPIRAKDETSIWERLASGERNVRFGKSCDYNEYVPPPEYSDEENGDVTNSEEGEPSHKPKKSLKGRISSWMKKRLSKEQLSEEEDAPILRTRSNSVDSIESDTAGDTDDEESLRFKKTPPRRSNTRKDRSGSPMLVRLPSEDDKKYKKAPVIFEN